VSYEILEVNPCHTGCARPTKTTEAGIKRLTASFVDEEIPKVKAVKAE